MDLPCSRPPANSQRRRLPFQEWISNSVEFVEALRPAPVISNKQKQHMLMTDDASTKVLGVCWKVASDALTFRISNLQDIVFTRTGLASIVARIYDPLGLAAPWIVKAKSKLRETRIRGLDWPDLVPEEDQTWWRSWADTLQELNGLALPRCLFPNEEKIVHSELHTLSDASEEAFASAVYIRNVYEDGSTMPDSSCRKLRWPSNKPSPSRS